MPRRVRQSRAVALGIAGTVLALGLLVLVAYLGSRGDVKLNFADEFEVGRTERLAKEIDDRGPFLFPDASPQRNRDVYIQHLGDDPEKGWLAIGARAPGQSDRECIVVPKGDGFEDSCSGDSYPADGEGLTRYETDVRDGRIFVDLRSTSEGSPAPAGS